MAQAAIERTNAESDPYWRLATEAEALILLSQEAAAADRLRDASVAGAGRLDAIASTRRQLSWLASVTGAGAAALAAMPVAQVLHWLADPAGDNGIELSETIRDDGPGLVAFGSLLSPADFALAEALRQRGAQLHLILPCAAEVCRDVLAGRDGPSSESRFDALLGVAKTVSAVTPEGDPGEATVLKLALMQARGHALLRGTSLVAPVRVLLCRNGRASLHEPGDAAADLGNVMARWPDRSGGNPVWSGRTVRAIVFGDVQGFSRISEAQHAAFLETVLGGFADALATLDGHVDYAETAGDGLYLVLSDVVAAVRACHALHESLDPRRLAAAGLPASLALRLSAHVGPVFHGLDRVIDRQKFFGKEVIRTARIEPVTPPGETYVTEQFASVLYCETGTAYDCEYVGHQPMAKGFGECRMYSLRGAGLGT
jgi:class 3 adenylate cyclase